MKKEKIKFYVERTSFWAGGAVIFALLAAAFQLLGCWGLWTDRAFALTQMALPIGCCLVFVLLLMTLGKPALWLTALPVLGGVVFFILRATAYGSALRMVISILLCVLAAVLYVTTVFGLIRSKWPLVPLFLLPFLYHVGIEDLAALRDTANPVTFAAGMQEIAVLCMMLALLLTALGMKKKRLGPEPELPKIKDPKVIPPEKPQEPEPEPQELPPVEEPAPPLPAPEEPEEAETI